MTRNRRWALALLVCAAGAAAVPAHAQSPDPRIEELEARTQAMERELEALREELETAKEEGAAPSTSVEALRAETAAARQAAQRAEAAANDWYDTTSVTHLAGYASADYVSPENGDAAFIANFNPIFHFQYSDRILWEAELEAVVGEDGATEIGLEYTSIDIFLNDNAVLVAGKFQSPIGNFRQNLHPSWINKLPSAPSGFAHDGAAPIAEVGLQLRGGFNVGQRSKITYAGYVGNGPKIEAEDGELHGIETDGFASDPDDEKVFGGRIGLLPVPRLDIGVSAAFGDASVVVNDDLEIDGDPKRDYEVFGVDASYRWNKLDLRGEYLRQKVGSVNAGVAPEGGTWETWYVQGAYRFGPQDKWEGVVRYADYSSPDADQSQEQWALGLNYLLTPSAMLKLAFESNSGLDGEPVDDNRWLAQVAYGY